MSLRRAMNGATVRRCVTRRYEMFFCPFSVPPRALHETLHKGIALGYQVHHAAVGMPDEGNGFDSTDRYRIGYFEFAIP